MTYTKAGYKPVSILLVEDDDIDAMSVTRAFARMKMDNSIVRAKDGIEALEILHLLRILRTDSTLEASVVFVLTTSKDEEDKLTAYKQHVAGYIIKESLDNGFEQLVKMLDHYWRLIELPEK